MLFAHMTLFSYSNIVLLLAALTQWHTWNQCFSAGSLRYPTDRLQNNKLCVCVCMNMPQTLNVTLCLLPNLRLFSHKCEYCKSLTCTGANTSAFREMTSSNPTFRPSLSQRRCFKLFLAFWFPHQILHVGLVYSHIRLQCYLNLHLNK